MLEAVGVSAPVNEHEESSGIAEQKQKSFEIYLSMPVVRFRTISRRVGLPEPVIKEWATQENWLLLRAQHRGGDFAETLKLIEERKLSARETLELCASIRAELKRRLGPALRDVWYSSCLSQLTKTLEKVSAIQSEQYKILGI